MLDGVGLNSCSTVTQGRRSSHKVVPPRGHDGTDDSCPSWHFASADHESESKLMAYSLSSMRDGPH